jgi:hypothetical protein
MRPILLFIYILFMVTNVHAQKVSGIWSGKIIRQNDTLYAEQNLELQMRQVGKDLYGITYCFNDSTQYVRMQMIGKLNKKKDEVNINEITYGGYFKLPTDFLPCVKKFELKYTRIGNDQYLIGIWEGRNAFENEKCFPNQTLLAYLKRVKKSEFKIEEYVRKDVDEYRKNYIESILKKKDSTSLLGDKESKFPSDALEDKKQNALEDTSKHLGLYLKRDVIVTTLVVVPEQKIILELYDNAEVDDDTVSVFINKQPVIIKQRLSAKSLIYEFVISNTNETFEILMQAENLGSIPPNTGKMVIKAGKLRREIDLSSDFKKSAAILIQYKKY